MDKLISLINKTSMSKDDRLELLDELYWADFRNLASDYPQDLQKIFIF